MRYRSCSEHAPAAALRARQCMTSPCSLPYSLRCSHPLAACSFFELGRVGVALPGDDLAVFESEDMNKLSVDGGPCDLECSAIPAVSDHRFAGAQDLFGDRREVF